jgi:hypothetical protein
MKFTRDTTEQEVREFLQERFCRLDDASACSISVSAGYLQMLRPGKPRQSERFEIFEAVSDRAADTTIEDTIETALSAEQLEYVDNLKRNYHRHQNRKHALLDSSRIYNEDDFLDALLSKHFEVAAAIFVTAAAITKDKILLFLNQY